MPTTQAVAQHLYYQSLLPRIRGLAACNMTSAQIAAELGIKRQAIAKICSSRGIKTKKRFYTPRLKRPPECPVNERRSAAGADMRFSAAIGRKTFDDASVMHREPQWRRLPPVTIVVGSASSMGGRYE